MERINFHNLFSFWTVAKEGGVVRASKKLYLAQPTISGQIRELERNFGQKLFSRSGRGLILTETGQFVFRYAEEIFALGSELLDGISGRPTARPMRLLVGVADVLPKSVAYRLIRPALASRDIRIVCYEGNANYLVSELSLNRLDVVLADAPLSPSAKVRAFSHLLGESGVSILAVESLAKKFRGNFPDSLDRAPFYLPMENAALRRSLDQWFDARTIHPTIKGEFEDSALLKFFARDGAALFPVPTVVEKEVCRQFDVSRVGRIDAIRERFYAISIERRLKHPAVLAISERARKMLKI
jgi:LysR family transcriptional activator of nhaA